MEFIVTDTNAVEKGYLVHKGIDIDIGVDNDFEIEVDINSYNPEIHQKGCSFFCPGTEYGGIIRIFNPVTSQQVIKLGGSTWRGILNQKALEPPTGQDYRYLNGEANAVIRSIFSEMGISGLFVVPDVDSGYTFDNYQVPLQEMLLDVLQEALEPLGARIDIAYRQGNSGRDGYVEVKVVAITDYSSVAEYSQDGNVNVDIKDYSNGTNHLICLGKGELSQRTRVDLYAWPDGSIQKTQYYTGIDEIESYYDYSSAEDATALETYGRKRLKEEMNYTEMNVSVNSGQYLEIGDIVGGRERITGLKMKSPVVQKIIKVSGNGITKITPKVKGED